MIVIAVLGLTFAAAAAQQGDTDEVRWDFLQPHRYAIEAKMRLPVMIWLGTRFNKQARFDVIDLRLVTQCAPGIREGRRAWQVECTLEEVAISAEALPQEVGQVQDIVSELDVRMTGAVVQLQLRDDGRLLNVDLERMTRRNRRTATINENVRQLLSRAFAGLDLPLPRRADEEAWGQYRSWIMQAPTRYGSYGTAQIVHQTVKASHSRLTIHTAGRGLIVPDDGRNKFRVRMVGQTVFDRAHGRILDRTWTLVGGPTASSLIAQGTEGYPYIVEGRLVALSEGQSWSVGESLELPRSAPAMTAIQQQHIDPLR